MEARFMETPNPPPEWRIPRAESRAGNWIGVLLLSALLACILLLALHQQQARAQRQMSQAEVLVSGQVFRVDVADTPALQSRGLGGRKALERRSGMLFVYADKDKHSFWMKEMHISIDIIWLDNQRVVHIEHSVPPPRPGTNEWELPTYQPKVPANLVLEIPAGEAKALGLKPGDKIQFTFGTG